MKTVITILLVMIMATACFSQEVGYDFGMIVSKETRPEETHSVRTDIDASFLNPLFDGASISFVYSGWEWKEEATEVYAIRGFVAKDVWVSSFYAAARTGGWLYANTDGNDAFRTALQLELGWRTKQIELHAGGDIISVKNGTDNYFLYTGFTYRL